MSDAERINWGILDAESRLETISDGVARTIAAQLHGSDWSGYTALSTTGAIDSDRLGTEILIDYHFRETSEEVRNWLFALTVYRLENGDRPPVEGWSSKWAPDAPEAEHQGYGACAVCGEDMPAGSEPHTYEDDPYRLQEVHGECCPTCSAQAPASTEDVTDV